MVSIREIYPKTELLFSWGRYLYWAELRQRDWWKLITENIDAPNEIPIPDWLGTLCYWASSLYVVIEGWERAEFNDPIIDALLSLRNHKDLLRKLRNGTFHYEPEIISPKMTEFLRSSDAATALLWLHFLHEEFCRWLRDCAEVMTTPEIASKWKEHCVDLFGWLPPRPAEEQLTELAKRRDEIETALAASGHDSGHAAVDLRSWLGIYDAAVTGTAERVREYRRTLLAKVGLNPDDYIR